VPCRAWPLILITTTALFQFLRNLADRRHTGDTALSWQSARLFLKLC
jgi:hypothetical protein